MDFKEFDKNYFYCQRKHRELVAQSLGYDSISECTAGLYAEKNTSWMAGMFDVTPNAVRHELRRLIKAGLVKSMKGPGGYHGRG